MEVERLYKEGIDLATLGKLAEAEQNYSKAQSLDPDFFALTGAMTYVYLQQKRYDQAIEHLSKTISKTPSYARGYWWLAQVYQAKGQTNLAADNLAKAKSLDPDDPYFSK